MQKVNVIGNKNAARAQFALDKLMLGNREQDSTNVRFETDYADGQSVFVNWYADEFCFYRQQHNVDEYGNLISANKVGYLR